MGVLEDMKKDPKMFAKLMEFSIKQKTDENLLYYFDKGNMGGLFPKYIKEGSPKEINISSSLRKEMVEAFNTKNEAKFKKLAETAREVCGRLAMQAVNGFKATVEYKYLDALEDAEKNAAKAMKLLGISNSGKQKLIEAIAWAKAGKLPEAKKRLEDLAKSEKLTQNADAIMKNLKSGGLL